MLPMGAAEAAHWGLVHAAVPLPELLPRARQIAEAIADSAPLAVQGLLELLPSINSLPEREAFARAKRGQSGSPIYERMLVSEDFLEGPLARLSLLAAKNWPSS